MLQQLLLPESIEVRFLALSRPLQLRPSPAIKRNLSPISLFSSSISSISIFSASLPSFTAPCIRPPQSHHASEPSLDEEPLPPFSGDSASIWGQMNEIVRFAVPAVGLWICGPLMSLIDTAVIGQGSSLELAALGPGMVVCDNASYVFMFLSIATSNMVATSLAKKLVSGKGCGLPGCWWALAGFQWARFSLALQRLTSHNGVLYSVEFNQQQRNKLKAA